MRRHPGRRLALLALVLAVGSCELPKPPIPQLPAGEIGPGSGQVAAALRAQVRDAGSRPVATALRAAAR